MVHGVLINFLYAGQHELSHGTVFETKWINVLFGRLFGFVLLYPRDFDKIQHWAHHQHTQNWEKDGELVREPYTLKSYQLWFWGVTYWQSRVMRIVRFCRGEVIEGVYAAGEVAGFGGGGYHGYNALEGTFLGGCLFTGRVAGREV
jgi:fatty acid desaturase